jgi:hypothetical protein
VGAIKAWAVCALGRAHGVAGDVAEATVKRGLVGGRIGRLRGVGVAGLGGQRKCCLKVAGDVAEAIVVVPDRRCDRWAL